MLPFTARRLYSQKAPTRLSRALAYIKLLKPQRPEDPLEPLSETKLGPALGFLMEEAVRDSRIGVPPKFPQPGKLTWKTTLI